MLPKRGNLISKHIIKTEEDIVFTIQRKLSEIPKVIIDTIEEAQEEKRNEMRCLNETQQQIVSVLEGQKAAFEKCDTPFPEQTMTLAIEPFKVGISNLQRHIDQLEEAKSELTLLSIFSVDRVGSTGGSKKGVSTEKMNQSRAEMLEVRSQEGTSPLGEASNTDKKGDE